MNYPTCTLHRLHCSALHLSPPLSLSVASRKPVTNQRRNCQRVSFFACPLWDTEDAANANAHACGAACSSKGAAGRRGEGVPCNNLPHALGFRACRCYGAAPSRDNCLFLSAFANILAASTLLLAMIRRRSITSAEQTAGLATVSPLFSPILSLDLLPLPSLLLSLFQCLGECSSHEPDLEPSVLHSRAPSLPRC